MTPFRMRATLALLFILTPLCAMAYSPGCQTAIDQRCGNIEPGAGRQTTCVIQAKASLPGTCRVEVYTMIERRPPFAYACETDAKKLCPELLPGKGRLYSCLHLNADQLSTPCKELVLQ